MGYKRLNVLARAIACARLWTPSLPRRQVLQQEGHPALNGLGGNDMLVIQHEDNIHSTTLHEVIGEHGQHGLRRRRLRGVQHLQCRYSHLCIKGLQGGYQVGEKARGVVVLWFQGEPGRLLSASRVVLPKPVGADTRVSACSAPCRIRSVR